MTHADIIARLTAATGPDQILDEAIWEAIGGWPEPEFRSVNYMRVFGTPVTASIDAAVALIERVLPGWSSEVRKSGFGNAQAALWNPMMQPGPGVTIRADHASSPPLARLLALFRALEAQEAANA